MGTLAIHLRGRSPGLAGRQHRPGTDSADRLNVLDRWRFPPRVGRVLMWLALAVLPRETLAAEGGWKGTSRSGIEAFQNGDYVQARELLQQAVDEAGREGDSDPAVATALSTLGALHQEMFEYDDAEVVLRRALTLQEKAPGGPGPQAGETLRLLGTALLRMREYDKALETLGAAEGRFVDAGAGQHPKVGEVLTARAETLLMKLPPTETSEAEALLARARDLLAPAGRGTDAWAGWLDVVGLLQFFRQEVPKAEKTFRQALEILERRYGKGHPKLTDTWNRLATLHHTARDFEKAIPAFRKVLMLREKVLSPDHPEVGSTVYNLAESLQARYAFAEAEPLYRRAVKLAHEMHPGGHPLVRVLETRLAHNYLAQKKFGEASGLLKAMVDRESASGAADPQPLAEALGLLAEAQTRQGDLESSVVTYGELLRIQEAALGAGSPLLAETLSARARALKKLGRTDEEQADRQRVRELLAGSK